MGEAHVVFGSGRFLRKLGGKVTLKEDTRAEMYNELPRTNPKGRDNNDDANFIPKRATIYRVLLSSKQWSTIPSVF